MVYGKRAPVQGIESVLIFPEHPDQSLVTLDRSPLHAAEAARATQNFPDGGLFNHQHLEADRSDEVDRSEGEEDGQEVVVRDDPVHHEVGQREGGPVHEENGEGDQDEEAEQEGVVAVDGGSEWLAAREGDRDRHVEEAGHVEDGCGLVRHHVPFVRYLRDTKNGAEGDEMWKLMVGNYWAGCAFYFCVF